MKRRSVTSSTTDDAGDVPTLDDLPPGLRTSLAALTAGEFGLFSTAEALADGVNHETLRAVTRAGVLVRVTHGYYAPRDTSLHRKDRHRRQTSAARRRNPQTVSSHHSALLEMELPAFAADLETAHLTHRTSPSNRRRAGCLIHRADHTVAHLEPGSATVGCADAVLQVGLGNPLATLVAADQAVRTDKVTLTDLRSRATSFAGHPGRSLMVAMLDHVDPSSESPAETLARHALTRLGHDVTPQLPIVAEGNSYRVDFALGRLVLEIDGMMKYLPAARDKDDSRTVEEIIRAERAREAAIVRAGHPVLRMTWSEIVTPAATSATTTSTVSSRSC
ncbi:hypothetical protein GCM10025883_06400 [Mobilicoccus caccae]|uniref:AbiEi antitoxin N-terminal domain-containing protein n=1 Tax=Mobilicoccus caccae TaxID=1859295 RepID=A0ABQ6IMP0_9MICO|nr:hypothetical protein GCM10025883_06400 [Mobilicoccus caccae]